MEQVHTETLASPIQLDEVDTIEVTIDVEEVSGTATGVALLFDRDKLCKECDVCGADAHDYVMGAWLCGTCQFAAEKGGRSWVLGAIN